MTSMCLEFNFETKLKMFLKNQINWFKVFTFREGLFFWWGKRVGEGG